MKKTLCFFAVLLASMMAIGQSMVVTFTGRNQNGNYHPFTGVSVQNQTRGWEMSLTYPDTILILNISQQGIADVDRQISGLSPVTPNPFVGTATATLTLAEAERVTFDVVRVNGQRIVTKDLDLPAGSHQIGLSLAETQVAFLVVKTPTQRYVAKLANKGNGGGNDIKLLGSTEIVPQNKAIAEGDFHMGDMMRYVGLSSDGTSAAVTKAQQANELITLIFNEEAPAVYLPTVSTVSASDITTNSATCGGNVTDDGGATVTARGVCWSTAHNPTVSGSHTTDGSGTGSFTSSITGLTANTTYYVRAYATNSQGTAYGAEKTFTTEEEIGLATVTTSAVSNITTNSATCGGNVTDDGGANVTARGVCWSTAHNPTVNDMHTTDVSGTGSFISSITGLTANTTYYVRAYATNSQGTAYGAEKTFTTEEEIGLATVTTSAVSNITSTTATCGGNVTDDGNATVTSRGVCWSTAHNPTVNDSHTTDGIGTGSFTSSITGLTANTTYYVRAYATNSQGTAYGAELSFTTDEEAVVGGFDANGASNSLFSVSATKQVRFSMGNLQYQASTGVWRFAENQYDYIGDDNANISSTYSGWIDLFGWGTSGWNSGANAYQPWSTSTTYSDYYPGGSDTNSLTGSYANADWGVYNAISNGGNQAGMWRTLTKDEWTYLLFARSGYRYVKATVNGIAGMIVFPDSFTMPTSVVMAGYNTTSTSFTTNVYSQDIWTVLEDVGCIFLPAAGYRNGTNTFYYWPEGNYWSSTYNSNYGSYMLYFPEESADVGSYNRLYGFSVRLVMEEAALPTVITSDVSNVTAYSATCGGEVTDGGNAVITARGVCWSTNHNPTVGDSHTTDGSGTGSFSSSITGLMTNTTYYVRAYAANSQGTAYGAELSFSTEEEAVVGGFDANGASDSLFSVSLTKQVKFSKGNLQYQASTDTWRFAENQYDYIGDDNANISSTYSGWIDLFGWGTSGWNNGATAYQPWSTSTTYSDYYPGGDYMNNLTVSYANADWGVYNAISNGGNQAGMWRTLTKDEWNYLLFTRSVTYRYAKAKVNGISGMIVFPDSFTLPSSVTVTQYNTTSSSYTSNVYSQDVWTVLQDAGCIFLPAAGTRAGTRVHNVTKGYYWSSTSYQSESYVWELTFYGGDNSGSADIRSSYRGNGNSVRLVQDNSIEAEGVLTVNTSTVSNITTTTATCGGNVTDDGNTTVTSRGVCWSTNHNPSVSGSHTNNGSGTGSFTSNITGLSANTTYYVRAYATNSQGIAYGAERCFITEDVGGFDTNGASLSIFSVSARNKIRFSKGNLQYQASTGTWRFAENQYDYIGDDNANISSTYSGWIDLFGWGTSGWNNGATAYQPWSTSTTYSDYCIGGASNHNLTGNYANADWGVYNAISNGGNQAGMWRTLTKDEWNYLLFSRSGYRYVKATVNGVAGLIVFPDSFTLPSGVAVTEYNTTRTSYSTNAYTFHQWSTLQNAGCIFLPAAGYRIGTNIRDVGISGDYWSSEFNGAAAWGLDIRDSYMVIDDNFRYGGLSVRLVKNR